MTPPHTFPVQAALGWLELGHHLGADEELKKITPQLRAHSECSKCAGRFTPPPGTRVWTAPQP
jgi:hypothetical protein